MEKESHNEGWLNNVIKKGIYWFEETITKVRHDWNKENSHNWWIKTNYKVQEKKCDILKPEERRSHRLNYLAKYWNKPNVSKEDLFNKALRLGVSEQTAKSYVNAVLLRFPRKIVQQS